MTRKAEEIDARRASRLLRRRVPAALPVKVRWLDLDGDYGDCSLVRKPTPHFLIRIDRTLGNESALMILAHEWAHAVSWTAEHLEIADHGPEWGIAYARVWRALVGEDHGKHAQRIDLRKLCGKM